MVTKITITKKMYGWSKYGGARKGLAKEVLPEWACQLCSTRHSREMPSYFVPETNECREYYRVCSACKNKLLRLNIPTFEEALALKVANLITLPARF